MVRGKQKEKPIKWWKRVQPFKLLFASFPSVSHSERRWALYQVILSFAFFSLAIAIGILTIDVSVVSGEIMIAAVILLGLGCLGLVYAFGLGWHWYKLDSKKRRDAETLHTDIQDAIKAMVENNKTMQVIGENIVSQTEKILELIQVLRDRNGKSDNT
jgi:hypothetical protein